MIRITWVMVLLFVSTTSLAWGGQLLSLSQRPIATSEGLALTDEQVAAHATEALQGSGSAASRLGLYYLATRNNRQLAEYWYLISAENGDSMGQYIYVKMIIDDSNKNRTRAIFWLKKSSEQGEVMAHQLLEGMNNSK